MAVAPRKLNSDISLLFLLLCSKMNHGKREWFILDRESGAVAAKSRAAPATVSGECRSECHWETGKAEFT